MPQTTMIDCRSNKRVLGLEPGCADWGVLVSVEALVERCEWLAACRVQVERDVCVLREETGELLRERMVGDGFAEDVVAAAVRGYVQGPVEVLQAVYGVGDIVSGANPYGCNQYGEGWAEEHNGNSTKYETTGFSGKQSKMLINKQGGNTVEVATKEKRPGKGAYPDASERGLGKAADEAGRESEKKLEEKEDEKNVSGVVVYARLTELFGKDVAEKFEEQVKAAPEWVRGFYVKHVGEAVKKVEKTKGISYHQSGTIALNANALKASKWKAENKTLFHEVGHALDNQVTKSNKDFDFDGSYGARVLHDTIKADYDALVKRFNDEAVERAKGVVAEYGGVFSKELFEAAYENENLKEEYMYSWYKNNPKVEHLPTAYIIALGEKGYNGKKPKMTKAMGARYLQKEINSKPRVLGIACDAFNYKNGIELKVGHNKSYYKKWGGKADAMETFANLFAMYAENDENLVKEVEKYLPKTCEKFKEYIKKNS